MVQQVQYETYVYMVGDPAKASYGLWISGSVPKVFDEFRRLLL